MPYCIRHKSRNALKLLSSNSVLCKHKIELPLVKVGIGGQQVSQANMPTDLTFSTDIHVENVFIYIST